MATSIPDSRLPMPVPSRWLQLAILTYLVGFSILGVLAYLTYARQPPLPGRVVDEAGRTLFTRADVLGGMNEFQRHGLMEYGSIYGHGAYLGPDFTAQYLHDAATWMIAHEPGTRTAAAAHVAEALHRNRYDAARDELVWGPGRAGAHRALLADYRRRFGSDQSHHGLQAHLIPDAEAVRRLTAFIGWTAWTATANRPGCDYSYTNNWPSEPLAGNTVTGSAVAWSAVSIIGLLCGMGLVLFFFGRYDWLGWNEPPKTVRLRPASEIGLTRGQRAVLWFLCVAVLLFLGQATLGGILAHYRVEPTGFYGVDLSRALPYNAARTWHVQLSIFWVSAVYLGTGIFLCPFISGREPRYQAALTRVLFVSVVIVVVGSLVGEYVGIGGSEGPGRAWFWFGDQGWEYLDLGRFWQILLVLGLFFWVFIVWRGLRPELGRHRHGSLPWLFFYSALTIPAFYAVGLVSAPDQGFVISDFWRFWVVHLWVEDFLELFTTVLVAYMFVLLGLVREQTAVRVIYLDVILYSVGGVVGTMHHLYFSGTPVAHLALGAAFSALEVIPLLLLTLEAWAFLRAGERSVEQTRHIHQWAVWFLVAVGVWNFLGAGVFGFLINLPVVSYFEIGTNLTANHAHTSMMGVYGMLAVGLILFGLRYLTDPAHWSDRACKISFWSLNIGLFWMAMANLFPVGIVQLHDALGPGYWHARSPAFFAERWVRGLEWARLPGDVLFVVGGILPLVGVCWRAVRYPNRRDAEGQRALPLTADDHEATPS